MSTLDAQPAGLDGSAILILVTGQLLVGGQYSVADISTNRFDYRLMRSRDPCLIVRHSNFFLMEQAAISFSMISSSWSMDEELGISWRKQ